jgi:hypothetical protein
MGPIVGSGRHTYHVNENWASVPDGIEFKPAAVAVDSQDRLFAFNRSAEHPVAIFDRHGRYEGSWGAGLFKFPHAIRFDKDDNVWLTDEYLCQFMQFTNDGKLLRTIGEAGHRSDPGVLGDLDAGKRSAGAGGGDLRPDPGPSRTRGVIPPHPWAAQAANPPEAADRANPSIRTA